MAEKITNSQFHMWRAVYAFASADDVVTREEVSFLADIFDSVPFSEGQRAVLESDLRKPPSVDEMFAKITEQKDRAMFFHYARMLAWCDGDFAIEEQDLMVKLQRLHFETADIDEMMRDNTLSLEEDTYTRDIMEYKKLRGKGKSSILEALARRFLNK